MFKVTLLTANTKLHTNAAPCIWSPVPGLCSYHFSLPVVPAFHLPQKPTVPTSSIPTLPPGTDSFLTAQRKQHVSLVFVIKNDWPLSWWGGMGVSSGSFLSREVEFSLPVHTENDHPDSLPRLAVSHLAF